VGSLYSIAQEKKDPLIRVLRLRAADYDDRVTETLSKDGRPMHSLNSNILQ
jgi:hypothetical protein